MKKNLFSMIVFFCFLTVNIPSYSCTSIYVVHNSLILAGKNQDFGEWRTILRFTPPNEGRYGKAFFGGKGVFPTGGMNSEGLFFELHQGEYLKKMENVRGKIVFQGNLIDKIMSECSNVQNVVDTLKKYTHPFLFNQNIAFGDKLGNSIILEGDKIFFRKGYYQICTSFYNSMHDMSTFPFWKYRNVDDKIKADSNLSVNLIRDALNSAHDIFTQYSVIYDFNKGIIYVFLYHDYDNFKIFNLKEEFQKGEHSYNLPDLFPGNKAYNDIYIKRQVPQNNWLIGMFLGLFVIASFFSLILAFTMGDSKAENRITKRIAFLTKLVFESASVFSLIYLARFLADPESLQIGILPPTMHYYSQFSKMVLQIPKLLIVIGIVMILLSISHWGRNMFSLFSRIYFSIYSTLFILLLLLFAYWNFVLPF